MSLLEKALKSMEEPKEQIFEDSKPPKAPKIEVEVKQEGLGIIQQIAMELVNDWDFIKGLGRSIKKVFPKQFKGVNLRTSNKKIVEQFDEKIKEVNEEYDIVEKLKREKKGDFTGVINEFKNKVAKIRGQNNGTD